MNDKRGGV